MVGRNPERENGPFVGVKVRDKTPDLLREEILIQHTITLNDLNKFNIALLNGEFAESSLRAVVDKMREDDRCQVRWYLPV